MSSTVAQMNVRLDRGLKARGDAVLAKSDITPTDLIRAIWEKISLGPEHALQMWEFSHDKSLSSEPHSAIGLDEAKLRSHKKAVLDRGRTLFDEGLNSIGLDIGSIASAADDATLDTDIYAQALVDRMRERGVW